MSTNEFILYYELMSEKIAGYILLLIGILIMVFAVINVFNVFTKNVQPVQLFSSEGISLDLAKLAGGNSALPKEGLETEIISAGILNNSLNLIAHLFFMGFLVNVGFRISSVGTLLIRTIKVNLKQKTENPGG